MQKTTGILVVYIVGKGKQLSVLIFSKEVLVAFFIFVKSSFMNVDPNLYCLFSVVSHSCIS